MLSCIYTFAHDLSAYLANIISSLIGNSDILVLNTAIFLLPQMEKWFNKARSLCPLIWNCCLQIFWLTQLYKPAWWKLENDPSHPTAQHKYQVKSWTSWTLYGDLHTSMKMDQLWKDRRGSNGQSLSTVIGNLNMERFKEQAVTSSPNIHRCGLLAGKYNSLCSWARLQVQH